MDIIKQYRQLIIIVLAVILVIGGAIYYFTSQTKPSSAPAKTSTPTVVQNQATSTQPASTSTSPQPAAKKPVTTDMTKNLTYQKAMETYKETRMQFDPACQVNPNKIIVKNNTKIMLDNRFESGRWISIGASRYYLDGYGFKIATVYSNTLPHTFNIDCGTGKNNAQITVQ